MKDWHLAAWEFWAPRYENLVAQPFSLKPTRELVLQRVVEACPGARRVLDVGCGVGQLAMAIANALPEAHVTAIDPTWPMIQRARTDYFHERIRYLHGEVEDLPCDRKYEVVVTTHAFPYARDPEAFLAGVRDLMEPGARLILAQACTETWWDAAFLGVVKLTTGPAQYRPVREIERLMRAVGLHPDNVRPVPTFPLVPALRVVEAVK